MELIPEWAPNLHPMIVHFPIVFAVGAIGSDLLALLIRRWDWLRPATVALYVAAGASAVFTYFTGTWAASSVSPPAPAEAVLHTHANLAWWTMWFFGIYALVRIGAHLWPKTQGRIAVRGVLFVVALGGAFLLYRTGDNGAKMVYKYGVGTGQVETTHAVAEPGLTVGPGGWQWRPQSAQAWTKQVTWLEGSPGTVQAQLDTLDTGEVALALTPQSSVAFVLPDTLGAVQVSAEVNLDAFEGTVSLLHHAQDARNYDYVRIGGGTVEEGRVSEGTGTVFDQASVQLSGWQSLRAVGDKGHFPAYIGGEKVMHGHGATANPGMVGLRIEGTGRVRIRSVQAEALRQAEEAPQGDSAQSDEHVQGDEHTHDSEHTHDETDSH